MSTLSLQMILKMKLYDCEGMLLMLFQSFSKK